MRIHYKALFIAHILFGIYIAAYLVQAERMQMTDLGAFTAIFISGVLIYIIDRVLCGRFNPMHCSADQIATEKAPTSHNPSGIAWRNGGISTARMRILIFAALAVLYLVLVIPLALKGLDYSSPELVKFRHQDEAFIKFYSGKMLDAMTLDRWHYFRGSAYGYGGAALNLALLPLLPFRFLIVDTPLVSFTALRMISVLSGLVLLWILFDYAYRRQGLGTATIVFLFLLGLPVFFENSFLANTPDLLSAVFIVLAVLSAAKGSRTGDLRYFFWAAVCSGAAHAVKSMGIAVWAAVICYLIYTEFTFVKRRSLPRFAGILTCKLAFLSLAFILGVALLSPYLLFDLSVVKNDFIASLLYLGSKADDSVGLVVLSEFSATNGLAIWQGASYSSLVDQIGLALGIVWCVYQLSSYVFDLIRSRRIWKPLPDDIVIALWVLVWSLFITLCITAYHSGRLLMPVLPFVVYGFGTTLKKIFEAPSNTVIKSCIAVAMVTSIFLPPLKITAWEPHNDFTNVHGWGKWKMFRNWDYWERINREQRLCVQRITQLFNKYHVPFDARITTDAYNHLLNPPYSNFNWGYCCIPDKVNPDVIMLDEQQFADFYQELLPEDILNRSNSEFFKRQQSLYTRFFNNPPAPYHFVCAVPKPFPGRVYAVPWARMQNVLTEDNVVVIRSSAFHSPPHSPGDIFLDRYRTIAEETYAAGVQGKGPQYFEFEVLDTSKINAYGLAYIIVHWLSPDHYPTDFSLAVKECGNWRPLVKEHDWHPGSYYTDYYVPITVPVNGTTFRIETRAYHGQRRMLLRGISFYVNPPVDVLTAAEVNITDSSKFFPSPNAPQDLFGSKNSARAPDTYAASATLDGGMQFFEFKVVDAPKLKKVNRIEIQWYNSKIYPRDFVLKVKESHGWRDLVRGENWRPQGPDSTVEQNVDKPIQGNLFRLESRSYEGQQRMLLRKIAFYRPPDNDPFWID